MSGSKLGGRRARDTILKVYGQDFYQRIGGLNVQSWIDNGRKPRGFSCDTVGPDGLTGRERARVAGRKGGIISRRPKAAI